MDRWIGYGFLYMIGWLMIMAQSSTSLVSALVGAATIIGIRMKMIRTRFSFLMLTGCAIVLALYFLTPIKDAFIESLGEDATLTGRTELWEDIGKISTNPLIGTGFESFWLGDRLEFFWAKYWWKPNQAHNGYLEMYLNLGLIGIWLQLWMITSGYRKGRKLSLAPEPPPEQWRAVTLARAIGEFRMAFMLGLIAFNFTDATFKALHPSFFIFFVAALQHRPLAAAALGAARPAATPASVTAVPSSTRPLKPRRSAPAAEWARAFRPSSLQRTR
jgi:O-antigen ligase